METTKDFHMSGKMQKLKAQSDEKLARFGLLKLQEEALTAELTQIRMDLAALNKQATTLQQDEQAESAKAEQDVQASSEARA